MSKLKYVFIILLVAGISACKQNWDDYYYKDLGEAIDKTIWELITENPNYSIFVNYIEENDLYSVFSTDLSLTVFVPVNSAFDEIYADSLDMHRLLKYHIMEGVMNIYDIEDERIFETYDKKYALLERKNDIFYIDGSKILESSPLCKDGRYYEIGNVLSPRPSLYEYISSNSRIFKSYIDQFDSIVMDYNKSVPLGFDSTGNTIYDSVFTVLNTFEEDFFPISAEFRNQRATMVLINDDQYMNALNEMAGKLGGEFVDHSDIPAIWQISELMPYTVNHGVFAGSLDYEDFLQGRLKNIAGDSIDVDFTKINEGFRYICSNGIIFNYLDYSIPEILYSKEKRIQGEDLVELIGSGLYGWSENVNVLGSGVLPTQGFKSVADNDSMITLNLGNDYAGSLFIEFNVPLMFPMSYRLELRAGYRPSGYYEISVNDEIVGYVDLFDLRKVQYSVSGSIFIPEDGLNSIDFLVTNVTSFGDVKIGIKWIDGGFSSTNGLSIDYISLIPY